MFRLVIFSCWFLAKFADSKFLPKPSQGKILGGHDTDITEVPYQVSLHYNESFECGGSIIGYKHILTAAHCVENKDEDLFSIRAGSNYQDEEGKLVNVVRVISHPNYDTNITDYDAAVLVLKEPLMCGAGVQIVPLANHEPEVGDMVLVSGWGSTGEDDSKASFLQSVSVPVTSKELCKEKHKEEEDEVTYQLFCAGPPNGEKDVCEGGSGGPAVVNGKLAGIVSWGGECGEEETPGVYTNIVTILDWIMAQIQE